MWNLAAYVEQGHRQFPDRPALLFEHEIFTYRQLDELCSRSANMLAAIGVRRGDRVAVVLPNVPAFLAAYFGALKLGALIVTVNTALKTDEVAFVLNDSGARVAITSADLREQLAHATLPA
ncbi:MAG: AMP-binding protein, partial [Caldilinea sp.]